MLEKPVRLVGYGAGKAEFANLSPEEVDTMQALALGAAWVRLDEHGRLVRQDVHAPLPKPTEDKDMEPFWRKNQEVQTHLQLDDFEPLPIHTEPSIIIQHLCGYGYTHRYYQELAEQLERWGFVCLRSRRDTRGQFWEIWYLAGFWRAEGELKEAIEKAGKEIKARTEAAKMFLARNSSFGTLDMTNQKLAMEID